MDKMNFSNDFLEKMQKNLVENIKLFKETEDAILLHDINEAYEILRREGKITLEEYNNLCDEE